MTPQLILAVLLAAAVLLASIRLIGWQRAAPPEAISPRRLALLLVAQPLCATLLYLTLVPPPMKIAAGTLVVATRGAGLLDVPPGRRIVALPEAAVPAERVPDLGTALRRHPDVDRLVVIGEGLPPRDRDAAQGHLLSFAPGAAPRGLMRVDPPARTAPGASFGVTGRVAGHAGGAVELVDPAGRFVGRQPLTPDGEFSLRGNAGAAGVALFRLRVRNAGRDLVEEADVPLVTAQELPPRILLLAGAPGPEPKFLRRWAADAGLSLHAHYPTGGGMAIGDGALPITGSTLARFDLAILDDRSWASLGASERGALVGAVRGGLGLMLRATGPLPDATRRQWQALGFGIAGGADVAAVRLAPRESPLTRRAIRISGRDMLPLLRDASGAAVAQWRAEGRGRVAIWPLTDSYALALAVSTPRYAELWSDAFAVLARARSSAAPRLEGVPRAGQRVAICGLGPSPRVAGPDRAARLVDEAPSRCAALWPATPGWHLLYPGASAPPWPFFVHAAAALPAARAAEARAGTLRLAAGGERRAAAVAQQRPGASWPWFLAWLGASAALWWFERAKAPLARAS